MIRFVAIHRDRGDVKMSTLSSLDSNTQSSILDSRIIRQNISPAVLSSIEKMECFNTLDSTNCYLLEVAKTHHPRKNWICLAEQQIKGRGRQGRHWISPAGVNIYLSLLSTIKTADLSGLSIAIGVIVAEALNEFSAIQVALKWPNDILFDHKKLGGILIETMPASAEETFIIMGIGLNVNMIDAPSESITQPWISLTQIFQQACDRNKLIGLIVDHCLKGLILFKQQGLISFLKTWDRYDYLKNKIIQAETETQTIIGNVQGINTQGFLLLKTISGQVETITSIKKIKLIT